MHNTSNLIAKNSFKMCQLSVTLNATQHSLIVSPQSNCNVSHDSFTTVLTFTRLSAFSNPTHITFITFIPLLCISSYTTLLTFVQCAICDILEHQLQHLSTICDNVRKIF